MATTEPVRRDSSTPVLARVIGYQDRMSWLRAVMIATDLVAVVGVIVSIVFVFHTRLAVAGTLHPDRALGVGLVIVSVLFALIASAVYLAITAIIGD